MLKKVKRHLFNLTHPEIGEVWQLHRVTKEHSAKEGHKHYEITPERLEYLIKQYKQKRYEFISITEVEKRMSMNKTHKFVCITFDDGYADNFEIAYPLLKKHNIPFCIYLCENLVLGKKREDEIENYRFLSIAQIQELANNPLCTLGCHTINHKRLSEIPYEEQLNEIKHCKEWVESVINNPVLDFAYPYGDYCSETITALQESGIKRAVAGWGGCVRRNTPKMILEIPRILVSERNIQ